jgi:hypothetical protein
MHVEDGFGSMTRAKRCSCRLPTGLIDTTTLSAHRDSGNGPGQLEAFRLSSRVFSAEKPPMVFCQGRLRRKPRLSSRYAR